MVWRQALPKPHHWFSVQYCFCCSSCRPHLDNSSCDCSYNYNYNTSMSEAKIEAQYHVLKQQYDQLLDKSQNDLIKIKQKEKLINEQLQNHKNQYEQKELLLNKKINELIQQLEQQKTESSSGPQNVLTVDVKGSQKKIQDLEIDVRRLMDQNIHLTAQNTSLKSQYQEQLNLNQELQAEVQRLKKLVESQKEQLSYAKMVKVQKETNNTYVMTVQPYISKEQVTALQEQSSQKQIRISQLKHKHKDSQSKLKQISDQAKTLSQSQKRYVKLLKKKQTEISALQGQINKLKVSTKIKKRTEGAEGDCPQCNNFRQQIQLLKQMVKSTQGMVRVKQIENYKYKIHSGQQTPKTSKISLSKHQDKITSLPPLKKK